MKSISDIKNGLQSYIDPEKSEILSKFFQAYPGGYGEGDSFLGIKVPYQRKIAKKYYSSLTLDDLNKLLHEDVHEYRLTAIFMLILKYEASQGEEEQKEIVDFYLKNLKRVNNWDLVDSSAYKILGPWFFDKGKGILYELARSGDLWLQRVSIMTTFYFIKQCYFKDTLRIAEMLINHNHDLIHKAVGWMLREIGNRDRNVEEKFLKKHYKHMPRTMLRYAIEKFPHDVRRRYLNGEV